MKCDYYFGFYRILFLHFLDVFKMKKYLAFLLVIMCISIKAQRNGNQINNYSISENLKYQIDSIKTMKEKHDGEGYLKEMFNMLMEYNDSQDLLLRLENAKNELLFVPDFVNPSSSNLTKVFKRMAFLYHLIDDYANALSFIEKAIDALSFNETPNQKEMADALRFKCKYQEQSGQFYSAISTGESALELYRSLQIELDEYVDLFNDLSLSYSFVLQHEKAIELQKQAITIYEKTHDWLSLAESLNLTAHFYQSMEKLDEAESYSQKAISYLYDHDNANQYIEDAITQFGDKSINTPSNIESINDRIVIDKSNCLQTLARIYFKKGNLNDAILLELENGKLAKMRNDEEMFSIHLLTLSQYYQVNHQYKESLVCCDRCIEIVKDKNSQLLGLVHQQMAITQAEMKNYDQAMQSAEMSASLLDSSILNINKIIGARSLAYYYYKNAKYDDAENILTTSLNSIQDTVKHNLNSMTSEQKQRFWSQFDSYFLLYRNIIWKSNKSDEYIARLYNYVLFSKNLLLDSEIRNGNNELLRLSVDWKDIQQKLSNKDIAVEFIATVGDSIYHTYHALVIDKKSKYPYMITLYNESDLEVIRNTSTQSVIEIVGNLIWNPILKKYKNIDNIYFSPDGVLNILPVEYCNVDGMGEMMEHYNLYRLSSTKEIVFQKKELSKNNAILYGGLDYDMLAKESTHNVDDEKYNQLRSINARGGFDPLMSTFKEVNEISHLLKNEKVSTTLYTGADGTEDSFKNMSGKDVNMLHLSTHGMYVGPNLVEQKKKENNFDFLELITNENDPVKEDIMLTHSFLVMSGGNKLSHHEKVEYGMNDGILTAFEISQTDLSKVDLVVLSACETGLGDIDYGGVYGLQRGFKKAGVSTILMSLDKVDDEATKILMVEFYNNLMSGKTKHESLKDAQKYLRQVDNGKYDKPEYWASFIMLDGLN